MGFMLRSDPMTFCEMYLQREASFDIVSELGELGCVQFLDMTPNLNAFHRRFVPELCRCAEMERKLRFIKSEIDKDDLYMPPFRGEEPPALKIPSYDSYETQLEKWERDIIEMSAYQSMLLKNHQDLSEMYYVLSHLGPWLGEAEFRRDSWLRKASGEPNFGPGVRLSVLSGVVRRSKSYALELMLWRISRGNVYFKLAEHDKLFEDPTSNMLVRKVAFLVVCQGEQLQLRIEKICTAFYANMYPCPKSYEERETTITQLEKRIKDLDQVLKKSRYYRCKALRTMSRSWYKLMIEIRKAKAVYVTMNLFSLDYTRNCLIGQCWVPDRDIHVVKNLLEMLSDKISPNVASFMSKGSTTLTYPTYHRTNRFTRGFQALINAYGDSCYRELNPGLYALITFPFLFAVMFGDVGHGLLMFSLAFWMVIKENKLIAKRYTNEIWQILFGGRYVILMMSLFAMFTGIIYNEYFCKPIFIFTSYWKNHYSGDDIKDSKNQTLALDPAVSDKETYPLGVDPIWAIAKNKIMFDNSLKMKMSIILGVLHMMFGLFLSFFNNRYFKHSYAVILEFIPEAVFLSCFFVWLVFLIFLKWFLYSSKSTDINRKPGCAPLVLIHFIDMCLLRTTKADNAACEPYMFESQQKIQHILVIVGVVCGPVLLFGTPIYLQVTHRIDQEIENDPRFKKYKKENRERANHAGPRLPPINTAAEGRADRYSFSELLLYQAVHTIEFVLSTISHTASYLRLWALSLAHSQLSEMLWTMVLSKLALQDHTYIGAVKLFFIFAVWAVFTVSILVVMEGLSAFLHTLRLHWVEFMSKFFIGNGVLFSPFTFKSLLLEDALIDSSDDTCHKKRHSAVVKENHGDNIL